MPKIQDWILNGMNSDENLVEDSPQFRSANQDRQKQNLIKASEEAMRLVKEKGDRMEKDSLRQTREALDQVTAQRQQVDLDTYQQQADMVERMTPIPVPLSGPDAQFFEKTPDTVSTPLTPNIPTRADFGVDDPSDPIPPPDPALAPVDPTMTPEQDEVAQVEMIAQTLGMTPQQVAAMVLLGKDINRIEKETPTPPPPPMPLSGPPPTIPTAGTVPPTATQAAPVGMPPLTA